MTPRRADPCVVDWDADHPAPASWSPSGALIGQGEATVGAAAVDRGEAVPASTVVPAEASTKAVDVACRALDIIVALILLALLAPLMLFIAAAIKLDSSGPVLFRQRRLGRSLRPFTVNKYRTMRHGASHDVHRAFVQRLIAGERPEAVGNNPRFKLSSDDRVTRVGRFLRRSSLDELPQLWNVVRGEMSLVGPRPPIPYEVECYPAHWFARFGAKPGITGLWQVSGRSELTLEEMIELDVEYVSRRSVWLNIWILLRTVPTVLSLKGAS
jgi:lipopolysaccharide/colanic/teichoic acid biosynthesis glycosyltransferase